MTNDQKDLVRRFGDLRDEIRSNAPTTERLRDWADHMADLCQELAASHERMKDDLNKIINPGM